MKNGWLKRALALLGALLFMAVLVLVPVFLYADTLYREALSAGSAAPAQEETAFTAFALLAEEGSRLKLWKRA